MALPTTEAPHTQIYCANHRSGAFPVPRVRMNDSAKLDDIREAVTTLEDVERRARRVFGGAHPLTTAIGRDLRRVQAALRARETPSAR